jgi:hypothetical protein
MFDFLKNFLVKGSLYQSRKFDFKSELIYNLSNVCYLLINFIPYNFNKIENYF